MGVVPQLEMQTGNLTWLQVGKSEKDGNWLRNLMTIRLAVAKERRLPQSLLMTLVTVPKGQSLPQSLPMTLARCAVELDWTIRLAVSSPRSHRHRCHYCRSAVELAWKTGPGPVKENYMLIRCPFMFAENESTHLFPLGLALNWIGRFASLSGRQLPFHPRPFSFLAAVIAVTAVALLDFLAAVTAVALLDFLAVSGLEQHCLLLQLLFHVYVLVLVMLCCHGVTATNPFHCSHGCGALAQDLCGCVLPHGFAAGRSAFVNAFLSHDPGEDRQQMLPTNSLEGQGVWILLQVHATDPKREEVVESTVHNHGKGGSSGGLVPADTDVPAVRGPFLLPTTFGRLPLAATAPVLPVVGCWFFAVPAGLRNFRGVQDFADGHLLDRVESAAAGLEVKFQR